MKLLFSLILLLLTVRVHASLNFTYSETPEYSKPKLIDILEVQTLLEERGYWPVDLSHDQKLKGIGVDQMFYDSTASKLVLLKFGQKVSDPKAVGQLLSIQNDFLFHGVNADRVPYALYFINHRETEARSALRDLGVKTKISFLSLLIPEAKASCATTAIGAAGALSMTVASPLVLQQIFNCGLAAGAGAKQSVKGFAEGVKRFVNDPESFWLSSKKAAKELMQFVGQIKIEVDKLKRALGGLDLATTMQIGCTIAGQLLPGIIAGVVTGGATSLLIARAMPMLALQVQKISSMGSALRTLSRQRQAGRLRNADRAVDQVVSCAR